MSNVIGIRMAAITSFVFVICLVFSSHSGADTFTVMNLNDSGDGSLRQAVFDANANENGPGVVDDIVFAPGLSGVIEFDSIMDNALPAIGGQMLIVDDVNIIGPGKDTLTIDAKNLDRIFNIGESILEMSVEAEALDERIKVSISGLRLINGDEKLGGAILNLGELTVDSCEFSNNTADSFGGAIYNDPRGVITEIKDSDFIMNSANFGGAIGLVAESAIIIKALAGEPAEELTLGSISGSTFDQNSANRRGGAILSLDAYIGDISDTSFTNNNAVQEGGGAIFIDIQPKEEEEEEFESFAVRDLPVIDYHLASLTDCEFTGNISAVGGAVFNNLGMIGMIADCNFTGNEALGRIEPENPDIEPSIVRGPAGNPTAAGGAIANAGGVIVNIVRSTFTSNMSAGFGGAIVNVAVRMGIGGDQEANVIRVPGIPEFERALIVNLRDSTFNQNRAQISGGAIGNGSSSVEILNTTFSENFAAQTGGALYNLDIVMNPPGGEEEGPELSGISTNLVESTAPVAFVSFSTFARNEAGLEGGAIYEEENEMDPEPESIHLRHSILALNTNGNCGGLMAEDEGGNHSDDDTCPLLAGNMANIVLGELADNGGPTMTVALLGGDPVDSAEECTAITMFGLEAEIAEPILPLVEADQRGAPRAFGAQCDAGAFEFGAVVPGGFFHNSIFPALASNPNLLSAEKASPEGKVAFVWGFMPGSTIIGGPKCGGTELGIKKPRLLGIVSALSNGVATLNFFIPLIGDFELSIHTQAVDINTCDVSEVIEDVIRKE